jgi:hypothetical protein
VVLVGEGARDWALAHPGASIRLRPSENGSGRIPKSA